MVTLRKSTKDVGELLDKAHKKKEEATVMLLHILSSVRYLARQGLALRGDGSDESSNLMQLLCLRAEDKPEILQWIKRSAQMHISPENLNAMLQLMAHSVLRKILSNIQSSPFIALMVDETTDKSNKEQLTLVIRWVDESFVASEEFLGLYNLSSITAERCF